MFDNRLKRLRESRNLTQKEAAKEFEMPQRTYSSYENNEREPNSEILKKLSLYFGVTVDYLLGIENTQNDMVSNQEIQQIKKYRKLDTHGKDVVDTLLDKEYDRCISIEEKEPTIEISYSFLPASAGSGEFLSEENMELREYPDTPESRQADVVIPVDGDSMEPMFYDGDELYVRLQPDIEIGQIGIFTQGGRGYVKEKGSDRLISINPDYPDIYPNEYEEIRCLGKVIGKVEKEENI